jgi:hypothetical protein
MAEEKRYRCSKGHVTTETPGRRLDESGQVRALLCGAVVENVSHMDSYNYVTEEHTPTRAIPWLGWCMAECEEIP